MNITYEINQITRNPSNTKRILSIVREAVNAVKPKETIKEETGIVGGLMTLLQKERIKTRSDYHDAILEVLK